MSLARKGKVCNLRFKVVFTYDHEVLYKVFYLENFASVLIYHIDNVVLSLHEINGVFGTAL